MSQGSNLVFKGLRIVVWIIFIGLSIDAGGLIINFIFSLFNPELVRNLYQKLDLSTLYLGSKWAYFSMYGFVLAIAMLKASLFYMVIQLLNKMDLEKPFNSLVSKQITQISYFTFSIGILSYVARQTARALNHRGYATNSLDDFWADGQAFILMAAVIYVIASIFAKGLELQNENDLTV